MQELGSYLNHILLTQKAIPAHYWSNFWMLLVQYVPSISHTFYIDISSKSYAMNRVGDFVPLILSFSTQLDQSIWVAIRVEIHVFFALNTSNITLITHMNIRTGADMVCPPNHLFMTQHLFRSEIYIGGPHNCVFQLQKHYIMHHHAIWSLIKVCK